jgi:hypothetical protein
MSTFDDVALDPAALDRLWDAMNRQIAPVGGRTGAASIAAADTIRELEDRDDAPRLAAPQFDAIWASVAAVTLPGVEPTTSAPQARKGLRILNALLALVQTVIRQAAIGAWAGLLVGFFVVGSLSRIFMRIAGMLSPDQLNGTLTENGNRVGEITLGGTFELMIFSGALPGLLGGIVVMAVRPWLPPSGWRRYLLSGAIGFAVAAPLALEYGDNPDYKRFGILGINVCLFTLLPFFFGVTILPVIDAFDRWVPRGLPSLRRGPMAVLASVPIVLSAMPLLALVIASENFEPAGLLVLLLPAVRVLAPIWARHAPTVAERHRRERRGLRVGYAAVAIPCLLGLVITVQSVIQLL